MPRESYDPKAERFVSRQLLNLRDELKIVFGLSESEALYLVRSMATSRDLRGPSFLAARSEDEQS